MDLQPARTRTTSCERSAFTVREFCGRNGISRTTYYKLKESGLGPREIRFGTTVRISAEEEVAWQRARSNPCEGERSAVSEQAERLRSRSRRATASMGRTQ